MASLTNTPQAAFMYYWVFEVEIPSLNCSFFPLVLSAVESAHIHPRIQ